MGLDTRIGIIGGGQLGKMLILAAKQMGFMVNTLDPAPRCPSSSVSDSLITAGFDDAEAIRRLAQRSDVLTFEFEHINAGILAELEAEGARVYPTAGSLRLIQNKLAQKERLFSAGLPVPEFRRLDNGGALRGFAEKWGFPLMIKAARGGYDGKGNFLAKSFEEAEAARCLFAGREIFAERFVDFERETSVLACRGVNGETAVYAPGENIHEDSILRQTLAPADIGLAAAARVMEISARVMEIFGGVGMFCVEFFLCRDGSALVNEVAPRVHNSGHYTIEGCVTSQFEQHIRAIAGLPLGDASPLAPAAVMMNLLGSGEKAGKAVVEGAAAALAEPGVSLHIYGKEICAPKRKMGHITAVGRDLSETKRRCEAAFAKVRIRAE
ncbi:MAG: 5-(carboxyamino)imidazole ribonucleotide synthase [Clostridiales bacterium]|nr:5-(carboxyamino)imidazole ribonucleotide synthase [Clostridiales bacterium]